MGPPPQQREDKSAGIDFLDLIFTVAISLGLTPEILNNQHFKGLLSQRWVVEQRPPSSADLFAALTFVLGFLTLALSWFGYHASIRRRPLEWYTIPGMCRFLLDIVLVVLYAVIMLHFGRVDVVLTLLAVVYGLYVVWDGFKIWEYWAEYQKRQGNLLRRFRREWVSAFWFVGFGGLLAWHFLWAGNKWMLLSLAVLCTVLYRVNKIWPMWERWFGVADAN